MKNMSRFLWLPPYFLIAGFLVVGILQPGRTLAAGKTTTSISEEEGGTKISPALREGAVLVHTVVSPFQAGSTKIRVLLPRRLEKGRRYPVLYVLPVEAKDGHRYGDGLQEISKADLHNKYGLICVAPTFSHLPWYADHPADKTIRQESYLLKVVLPFVERCYPARHEPQGRLLLGFSKSGWGAFALLLRHPQLFGKAAAWDAPLMKEKPDQFGMGPIFGTQENFERYRITTLLKQRAGLLANSKNAPRLILLGYGNFRRHHRNVYQFMQQHGIRCLYRDGPFRKHHWNSGWISEAVSLLAGPTPP